VGGKGRGGGRGEKLPKPYIHIWIIKQFKKKRKIKWIGLTVQLTF
jgi:hypothetical protein